MALAVALAAVGAGCSDRVETVSDVEAEPPGLGTEVTVPISSVVTALVQPGDGPRQPLRPALAPGAVQRVTLRTINHIEQQINDQATNDISPPGLTIPLSARADADGCALTLGPPTSSDAALTQQLVSANGSHIGLSTTPQGAITTLRLDPKPATTDTARAALEQAFSQAVYQSIAFPLEPVGAGAVWTVRQQVSAGVPLDQVTTATLTKREGNVLTIALNITQTPKEPSWDLPNNAGALDIVDYIMHGAGTITVDLGLPLPVSGLVTLTGQQAYRDPSSAVLLRQHISTQVQWGE